MPDDTVIGGEVVALDQEGKPSFNTLQNHGFAGAPLHFFVFDVLILRGKDAMSEPLIKRRTLLEKYVLPFLEEPIRYSPVLERSLKDLIQSVKAQGLEGLVAKRRDSRYEPGDRSGAWQKMRINKGQSLSSAVTPSAEPHSTRWCLGTMTATSSTTQHGRGMTSHPNCGLSCLSASSLWKPPFARLQIFPRRSRRPGELD
jgi:hypothetical protein